MDRHHASPFQQQAKRTFLRIQVRLPAILYFNRTQYKQIRINELSAGGLSFTIAKKVLLPELFELHLKLKPFSPPIGMTLRVRSRTPLPDGSERVGCQYVRVSEGNKLAINDFIWKYAYLSSPFKVVYAAAFFLCLDASLRLFLFLIQMYYGNLEANELFPGTAIGSRYLIMLLAYFLFSLGAFISIDPSRKRTYVNFLSGIACLTPPFLFILSKNLMYFRMQLWYSRYALVKIVLGLDMLLMFFVGFVVAVGFISLPKVKNILHLTEEHLKGMRSRKTEEGNKNVSGGSGKDRPYPLQ
ncbi:MAG: PilZ domain-containing protein [Candidatus Omnitrophica bacterium]|nr:PilZ domain-containing protein [Candidatus Omnitrophota bacterium]